MVAQGDGLIIAGGDPAVLARWRPLLESMLSRVVHVGPAGHATLVKLVANLLVRKLRYDIDRHEASVTLVDEMGNHVYQPGFMYIAMGGERAEKLVRPERSLLDEEVQLQVRRAVRIDEAKSEIEMDDGSRLGYDQLVIATGSRIG